MNDVEEDGNRTDGPVDTAAVEIIAFQLTNVDAAVPGTSYSQHFVDVQLRSLEVDTGVEFCASLFARFVDLTADSNVRLFVWRRHRFLVLRVLERLDEWTCESAAMLPDWTSGFLTVVAALMDAQLDVVGVDERDEEMGWIRSFVAVDESQDPTDREAAATDELDETEIDVNSSDVDDANRTATLDYAQLLRLSVRLLLHTSCTQTLIVAVRLLGLLLQRQLPTVDANARADYARQLTHVFEADEFGQRVHFVLVCSVNRDLLRALGRTLSHAARRFPPVEFAAHWSMLRDVLRMRTSDSETREANSTLLTSLLDLLVRLDTWPSTDAEFVGFVEELAKRLNPRNETNGPSVDSDLKAEFYERIRSFNSVKLPTFAGQVGTPPKKRSR